MAVITISREFGSGGLVVARRAAELLGYSFLDRGVVTEVARLADVPEREVERYDERGQNFIADALTRAFWGGSGACPLYAWGGECAEMMVAPALLSEYEQSRNLDRDDVVSLIEQVIRAVTERGSVVIVGRGAHVILADRSDTLHVRLIAPVEWRCQRVVEREGISPEEAMDLIRRTDRDRVRYLRQLYQADWGDERLYHMTINTARTGIELGAHLIAGLAGRGLWVHQAEERSASIPRTFSEELLEVEG